VRVRARRVAWWDSQVAWWDSQGFQFIAGRQPAVLGAESAVLAAPAGAIPEGLPGTSQWSTLRLACAVGALLYLYYGEDGKPSTFDPAGELFESGIPAGWGLHL
jgi:hypothetical protein